ncbi:hypothetical protein BsWGS_18147 [Bradybaena similaris]
MKTALVYVIVILSSAHALPVDDPKELAGCSQITACDDPCEDVKCSLGFLCVNCNCHARCIHIFKLGIAGNQQH